MLSNEEEDNTEDNIIFQADIPNEEMIDQPYFTNKDNSLNHHRVDTEILDEYNGINIDYPSNVSNNAKEYNRIKNIEKKNKIFQNMHFITGLSKIILSKLIAQQASLNLQLERKDIGILDRTNSDEYYMGQMKAGYKPKRTKEEKEYEIGERFDLDIGRPMKGQSTKNVYPFYFQEFKSKMIFVFFGKSKTDLSDAIINIGTMCQAYGFT
jgi:hypothetical protein